MTVEVASRLREYREKSNLSQMELAEKIGVAPDVVASWEKAEESPAPEHLVALSKLYNVLIDDLLNTQTPFFVTTEERSHTKNTRSKSWWDDDDEDEDDDEDDDDDYEYEEGDEFLTEEELTKKKALHSLPVPILVSMLYLAIGFMFNAWHPTWLIFFIIPLYYTIVSTFMAKGLRSRLNHFPIGLLIAPWYLMVGFAFGWWHPAWLVFLLIPIYYTLVNTMVPE